MWCVFVLQTKFQLDIIAKICYIKIYGRTPVSGHICTGLPMQHLALYIIISGFSCSPACIFSMLKLGGIRKKKTHVIFTVRKTRGPAGELL